MTTCFEEKLKGLKRKYYEVFGDLEKENDFLKKLCWALVAISLLSLLGTIWVSKKPPVVIRVNEAGKAEAITNIKANNKQTSVELIYFTKNFTRHYTEYNAYTVSRDMTEAFNDMSSKFRANARKSLIESGFLGQVKTSNLKTEIEFKDEKLEKESSGYALISLVFVRTMTSYTNPNYRNSKLMKCDVVLRKYPRSSRIPAGVLVDQYQEKILNQLEEKQ